MSNGIKTNDLESLGRSLQLLEISYLVSGKIRSHMNRKGYVAYSFNCHIENGLLKVAGSHKCSKVTISWK